jgi:hypothetical protein
MSAPHPEGRRPDVSLLADLDAGVLDEAQAREVRAAVEADPSARAVLEALAATRADLAAVGDPPVPAAVAERWRAALRAEQAPLPPAPRSAAAEVPPQRRPSRRLALVRRPAVLAAVLLVAVLVGGGLLKARQEQLPAIERPQLAAQGISTIGVRDTGGLEDPVRRSGCLQVVAAPGVAPAAPLLGGRRVTFEGEPGVLLVLGTGRRGTFDIVIVDPACGPGSGTLLATGHVAPQ